MSISRGYTSGKRTSTCVNSSGKLPIRCIHRPPDCYIVKLRRTITKNLPSVGSRGKPLTLKRGIKTRHPLYRGVKGNVSFIRWEALIQGPTDTLHPVGV